MVFEENTLRILHPLTEEGKIRYQKYIEQKADEILFKNEHPLIYLYNYIAEKTQSSLVAAMNWHKNFLKMFSKNAKDSCFN